MARKLVTSLTRRPCKGNTMSRTIAFAVLMAFATPHGGHAQSAWQNPVDLGQTPPQRGPEYYAPAPPDPQYVYHEPTTATVCTLGVGKSKNQFFCQ
jgi:hypothetical protein